MRILLLTILLAGCSDIYRCPCQNPDNWEHKVCKKPYCSANGTCPEDLTPYERERLVAANKQPVQATPKDCK